MCKGLVQKQSEGFEVLEVKVEIPKSLELVRICNRGCNTTV